MGPARFQLYCYLTDRLGCVWHVCRRRPQGLGEGVLRIGNVVNGRISWLVVKWLVMSFLSTAELAHILFDQEFCDTLISMGREALNDMLGGMATEGGVGGGFGGLIDGRSSRTMVKFAVSTMLSSSS
jgi:hypothetical protein